MYPVYNPGGTYIGDPFGVSPPSSLDPNYNAGPGGLPTSGMQPNAGLTPSGLSSFSSAGGAPGGTNNLQQLIQNLQGPTNNLNQIAQMYGPSSSALRQGQQGLNQPLANLGLSVPQQGGGGAPGGGGNTVGASPLAQLGNPAGIPGGGMGTPSTPGTISGPGNPTAASAIQNAYLAALGGNPNANPLAGGMMGGMNRQPYGMPGGYGGSGV